MRILGIDPGYAIIGWGVVDYEKNKFHVVDFGAITTEAGTPFSNRLNIIYDDIKYILQRTNPDAVSMERLYFQSNQKTAIDVAQARGVLMLAAAQCGVEVFEYTPTQVKQAVTGYGTAEKKQVMEMTKSILGLENVPKPDDTADALAMAICHAHCNGVLSTPSTTGNGFGKKEADAFEVVDGIIRVGKRILKERKGI